MHNHGAFWCWEKHDAQYRFRLETLTAGKLIVCGKDLALQRNWKERSSVELKSESSISFSIWFPIYGTSIELPFLVYDERPDSEAVNASIEMLRLAGRIEHYPSQLSGGEQQACPRHRPQSKCHSG